MTCRIVFTDLITGILEILNYRLLALPLIYSLYALSLRQSNFIIWLFIQADHNYDLSVFFVPFVLLFLPIVEEDEDEFLTATRADGEHNHNNNGSKEKCESICKCLFYLNL